MTTAALATKPTRRERWAWYMYDFGNSAYASVVLLAVYSAYFEDQVVGGSGAEGSNLWGWALAIAMLVVALISPVLGALADFTASKKRFLLLFTVMACLFTASLFFVKPGAVVMGVVLFILAEIGYRAAQVYYNGLLPEIAEPHEMGRVSGYGWAIGTAGGVVCLLLVLALVMLIGGTVVVRLSMIVTAVFFALAAVPIFLWLRERAERQELPEGENYLSIALKRLGKTIRTAGRFREFVKFMVAFLVYNDGIIMALDFAAIIGAVLYGMTTEQLIIFMIIVQITNVAGAYLFGILVDRLGGKRSLVLSLLMLIAVVIWLYFNQTLTGYFVVGAVAGVAMAGAQSVSRTMVAIFAPPGQSAEFYGFFAVIGRTSSVIGPLVFGLLAAEATGWFQSQGDMLAKQSGHRVAILSIAAFLVVGLILLLFVDEKKARVAASQSDDGTGQSPA